MPAGPGLFRPPPPENEPVKSYAPGTPEREELRLRLQELKSKQIEAPMVIGGEEVRTGDTFESVMPHDKDHVLAEVHKGDARHVEQAIKAAADAWEDWHRTPWEDRAAVFLRAADLLAGPWRPKLNAATMLGQSKTAIQDEIDSACELIDFCGFNAPFGAQVLAEQPISAPGVWNRLDHRPLEGFVYAITPFNFTAIAGNLPTAPALMGNTVVWKPSPTQQLAAHYTMRLLEAAGLPPGVVNLVTGDGLDVSEVALADPDLAGIHFTGSTRTFQHLWGQVGANIAGYRSYPRVVGETGGKDFVLAHPSADADVLRTALVRGAFEYQGQKCSAASRAFVPESLWRRIRDDLASVTDSLAVGPVTDFTNFMGAVIDDRAFAKHRAAIDRAHGTDSIEVLAGGTYDDSEGWFVRPTVLVGSDVDDEIFSTEYFGPVLSVHVYPDGEFDQALRHVESGSAYALTGSIIAQDREVIARARDELRFAAGNFYVNDKPTGAVVGQQPFGGGRASGTNDKAGALQNLQRWTSTRSIKETLVPATDHRYPHMA